MDVMFSIMWVGFLFAVVVIISVISAYWPKKEIDKPMTRDETVRFYAWLEDSERRRIDIDRSRGIYE